MRGHALLLVLGLLAAVSAITIKTARRHECLFNEQGCNHAWTRTARANADSLHTVVVSVKHREGAAAACDSLLMEVSNPNSTRYGQYLTMEQVNAKFRSYDNLNRAKIWLETKGFETVIKGFWIHVTAPVALLEEVFKAEFHHFTAVGKFITRSRTYTIPREMANTIDFVSNTVVFPPVNSHIFSPLDKSAAAPNGYVTPATVNTVYGVKNNKGGPKSTQALFEALGQQFSPSDLAAFQSAYNLPKQPIAKVVGSNDPSQCSLNPNACVEANLDTQYMIAMSQGSPTWYWSIDSSSQDPFYDWIQALGNTQNAPLVHSISYGSIATEDPKNDMIAFNTELCTLGARGITVSVSSGDDGVANFEARNDPSQCGFNPSFPATSPYVVSVGATQGPESGQPEVACSSNTGGIITTGGGFSVTFKRPFYQAAAVDNYLKRGPNVPPTSQFNSKGRGYPDIALLGFNYEVVVGGNTYGVSGTSASSPVWAGLLSLINARRQNAGKPALGFVNPSLYKLASSSVGKSIFNDITSGENNCCAAQSNPVCCQYGFTAFSGWDPLTGLGSVNFEKLSAALVAQ